MSMHGFTHSESEQPSSEASLSIDEILNLRSRGKLKKAQPLVVSSLGTAVPEVPHAVSVCMPLWKDNVDYEEGDPRVHSKLQSGYPRFCFHQNINLLVRFCRKYFALDADQSCLVFPSQATADRCIAFIQSRCEAAPETPVDQRALLSRVLRVASAEFPGLDVFAVCYPAAVQSAAKTFWQHTGEILSSRQAEATILALLSLAEYRATADEVFGKLAPETDTSEAEDYIEEYFGRNLPAVSAANAKRMIKERIASLSDHKSTDVLLFPTGMNAIYTAHRALLCVHPSHKSVMFGFPYLDTLKILQKFGPGVHFLGHGSDSDLMQLETILEKEPILAVFCEFPSNPLCKSPPLEKLARLVAKHNSLLIVDDTIGNAYNCAVHKYADIVATSLTKLFSGESNVMGGSLLICNSGRMYPSLLELFEKECSDMLFDKDAVYLERNSRDFKKRAAIVNRNTERLCDFLSTHPRVKQLFFPKFTTRENYDLCRTEHGGFGSLFSIVFPSDRDGQKFFDHLPVSKGPSLGTNFTLCCPYTILAHYTELEFAEQYGIASSLVRVSIGLEDYGQIHQAFNEALDALSTDT